MIVTTFLWLHIPTKCELYPLNTAAALLNSLLRHGHLSRKISFVVFRLSCVLKTDLFTLILCGVCLSSHEPSLSNLVPLYSRRAAHPKEGLDIQLATVPASSLMQRLATYTVQINILFISKHCRSYIISLKLKRIEQSLLTNCQTSIIFNPLMRVSLIIHLLHHDTLVTGIHLWSQRSNHDRREA